jgi:hypothetical protein
MHMRAVVRLWGWIRVGWPNRRQMHGTPMDPKLPDILEDTPNGPAIQKAGRIGCQIQAPGLAAQAMAGKTGKVMFGVRPGLARDVHMVARIGIARSQTVITITRDLKNRKAIPFHNHQWPQCVR